MKIERYVDTEEFKNKMTEKAGQIVERIMMQIGYLSVHVPHVEDLVVFISNDLLAVLACIRSDDLTQIPYPNVIKICGYEVKPIDGTDELYIGVKA